MQLIFVNENLGLDFTLSPTFFRYLQFAPLYFSYLSALYRGRLFSLVAPVAMDRHMYHGRDSDRIIHLLAKT